MTPQIWAEHLAIWQVVGGADKGGILVRSGQAGEPGCGLEGGLIPTSKREWVRDALPNQMDIYLASSRPPHSVIRVGVFPIDSLAQRHKYPMDC